ncbi:MAG: hypothetical protein AAF423_14200 [Pseudomonadota bacterium]
MSTVRSPSYPSIPLKGAIERVGILFEKERFNPISREAAAKLFGYSGLTGGSNTLLADLAAYGLIERVGKGEIRVSQRVAQIIHPHDDAEYSGALASAAQNPKLFSTLRERFPDHLPSDDNLEGVLVRMGFSAKGTRPARKAFLETFRYLQEESVNESHGDAPISVVESSHQPETRPRHQESFAGRQRREVRPGMKEDVYTLPEGDVVLQWPEQLSQESYDQIEMWSKLMLRKIAGRVVSEDNEARD